MTYFANHCVVRLIIADYLVGNGIMHPVQEQVNTLGIVCSIRRLTEYIFIMKGTVFQPRVLQLSLDSILRQKKSGNVQARDSNPRPSACKADAQTIRPPDPADIPQCN